MENPREHWGNYSGGSNCSWVVELGREVADCFEVGIHLEGVLAGEGIA